MEADFTTSEPYSQYKQETAKLIKANKSNPLKYSLDDHFAAIHRSEHDIELVPPTSFLTVVIINDFIYACSIVKKQSATVLIIETSYLTVTLWTSPH
jgi:hypothetical protein